MNISIKKTAEETIIELAGRLDTTSAPELEKVINEDVEGTKNLVFNVKALEYISSAGLRVFLSAHKKMQTVGTMKLLNVCEDVMDVFEITGFADFLTIE